MHEFNVVLLLKLKVTHLALNDWSREYYVTQETSHQVEGVSF